MAENEKEISAGFEIIAKLKTDAAQLIRDIADIEKRGILIKPTADAAAIRAVADQTAKTFEQSGKDAEKAIATERMANLRIQAQEQNKVIMDQLRQEVAAAKDIARAKASAENDAIRLRIMEDRNAARDLEREHKQAVKQGLSGLGLGTGFQSVEAGVADAKIRQAMASNKAVTEGMDEARRKELDLLKASIIARSKEHDFLRDFGQGLPPRRTFSQMFTGGLMGMGMGETGASVLGGIGGILAGSMVFRAGWEMLGAINRIPDAIMDVIQRNQNIDTMRARMAQMPTEQLGTPGIKRMNQAAVESDKALMADIQTGNTIFYRLGAEREAYQQTIETLQTDWNSQIRDPGLREQRRQQLARFATQAHFGQLYGGGRDPRQVANAMAALQFAQSPEALNTLLSQPGMMEYMVGQDPYSKALGGAMSTQEKWKSLRTRLQSELGVPDQTTRQRAVDQVLEAYANTITAPGTEEAAATKIKQRQPGKRFWEWWAENFGDVTNFGTEQREALSQYISGRQQGLSMRQAREGLDTAANRAVTRALSLGLHGLPESEDIRRLIPAAEAYMGNFRPMLFGPGGRPQYDPTLMMPQPNISFYSPSEFANRMQTQGGFSIDSTQAGSIKAATDAMAVMNQDQTVQAIQIGNATLMRIEQKMGTGGLVVPKGDTVIQTPTRDLLPFLP